MTHHIHAMARVRLALLSPLFLAHCALYPAASDYDVHRVGIATFDHDTGVIQLHLRLNQGYIEGYYVLDLPHARIHRSFYCRPTYYRSPQLYQGEGGRSTGFDYQDDDRGSIEWFEADRSLKHVVIYDKLSLFDTIPHFTGIRIETSPERTD